MANDQQSYDNRKRGGSTSTGTSSHVQGHHISKHSREYRMTVPQPVVPPTCLRRTPTYNRNGHGTQPAGLSAAPMSMSAGATVPDLDPEAMPAKRGLNEWGAFNGGGGSGTTGASAGSTFGFGPLLFHHAGIEQQIGDEPDSLQLPTQKKMGMEMDSFEMDQLLLNDPISFNPMQAISWAKLDDESLDETSQTGRSAYAVDSGRSGSGRPTQHAQRGRTSTASTKSRHGRREDHNNHHAAAQMNSVSASSEPRNNNTYASYAVGRGAEYANPGASPVGTISQTFSAVRLQTPDVTDGRSSFVPPGPAHVSGSNSSQVGSGQPGQRQQRKHRHRHGTKNSPHIGPSPTQSEAAFHQQAYQQPPPPPPPPLYPPSAAIHSQNAIPLAQPGPYPNTYQASAPYPHPTSSLPPSHHPGLQGQADLFLCLGPYCSARFPSEHELNTHYRAEHSLACSWASCGAAGFTSNNALVWHVKAEHLLLCPVPGCCDRVFANRKALDGHVRVS